jgi:hypothetical protein
MSAYIDDTDARALHYRDAGCDHNWDKAEKTCAESIGGGDLIALLSWQAPARAPGACQTCQLTYQGYVPLSWIEKCMGEPIESLFIPSSIDVLLLRAGSCAASYIPLKRERFMPLMLLHAQAATSGADGRALLASRVPVGRHGRLVYARRNVATLAI